MVARLGHAVFVLCMLFDAVFGQAYSQSTYDTITEAASSLSFDLVDCSQYYFYASVCAEKSGFQAEAEASKRISDMVLGMSYNMGKAAGLSEAALLARVKLSNDKLKYFIDSKCINMAVLIEKYAASCKSLVEKPDEALLSRTYRR